jgi:hypothetical protein
MAGVAVEGEDMEAVCLDHETSTKSYQPRRARRTRSKREFFATFASFASFVVKRNFVSFVVEFRVVLSPMTW